MARVYEALKNSYEALKNSIWGAEEEKVNVKAETYKPAEVLLLPPPHI